MSHRGFSKALRHGNCTLQNLTRGSRRPFASSAICQKQATIPSFTKTSSPELDELFASFREKVFLPAHLSKVQQDLIFKQRHTKAIAADPVMVNIGGEVFKLQHIDRLSDVPNSRTGLGKALRLMQDKNDWDNLPRFLSGLFQAGRKMSINRQQSMMKVAAKAGRLDVILECARRVHETGFQLRDRGLVNTLAFLIYRNAMASDWGVGETKKALSWVEMVSVMLEDPKHAGNHEVSSKDDPRGSPELVGILLGLSAIRAARHLDGKDQEGKVAEYATRLLSIPTDLKPTETPSSTLADVRDASHWLALAVPVAHGMRVAQTVLGPASEVTKSLETKRAELEGTISQQRDFIINSGHTAPFTASMMYDKLLGEGSA